MWKKILISIALFVLTNAEEESTVKRCYSCGGTTDLKQCDINTLIENKKSYGCNNDTQMCTSAAVIFDGTPIYVRRCVPDGCIGLQKGNPTGKFAYCYNCPDSNCNTDVIPDASACAKQLSAEGSGGSGQASGSISGCGASVSASGTVSAQQTTASSLVETTMKPPKSPDSV